MNDMNIKFDKLEIPEPSLGFEERIINKALYAPRYRHVVSKLAIAAAFVVVMFTAVVTNLRGTETPYDVYASYISGEELVSESDVYDDIILAGNF